MEQQNWNNLQNPSSITQQAGVGKAPSVEELQAWFVTKLVELLDTRPESIDLEEPFASYGLESVDAVGLSGELEERRRASRPSRKRLRRASTGSAGSAAKKRLSVEAAGS